MTTSRKSTAVLFLLLVVTGAARLSSQSCYGLAPLSETSKRVGGVVEIGSGYTLIQGSLTLSRPNGWFGILNAGVSRPKDANSGLRIGVDVGRDLDKWFKGKVKVCGYAGINLDKSDAYGVGSATDFRLGATAAYPLPNSKIVLTGSYTGIYERYSIGGFAFEGEEFENETAEEYFGLIDIGPALSVGNNFTLIPGARLYFRYGGGHKPGLFIKGSIGIR